MNDWLIYILLILAAYRISIFVPFEDGPFYFMLDIREFIYKYLTWYTGFWFYQGLTCPLCVGVWASFILAIWAPGPYLLSVIAIAGAQTFLIMLGGVPDNEEEG